MLKNQLHSDNEVSYLLKYYILLYYIYNIIYSYLFIKKQFKHFPQQNLKNRIVHFQIKTNTL